MPYAKIEPSGCGIHKNRAKLRLDFFLNPGDPNYDKYPSSPFHSHFIYPDKDAPNADIKAEIEKCLNYFYAFHQHCWDKQVNFIDEWRKVPRVKGSVRDVFVKGDPEELPANKGRVQNILSRVQEFQVGVSKVPVQDLRIGDKGTIDIGPGATDRTYTQSPAFTWIDVANPANDTGTIDTFEVWANETMSGTNKVGTFYGSGTSYTNRDGETIGTVTSGAKRTFTGLSIDVVTGDFAGIYFSVGKIEAIYWDGAGAYYEEGDQFGTGQQTYSFNDGDAISIYGTGTEEGVHYDRSGTALLGLLGAGTRPVGCVRSDTALLGLFAGIGMFEYYNTGDDIYGSVYGENWKAQTFTPSQSHKITKVNLKFYRYGSPGTITISIRDTDENGHPTGEDLCSGTTDGNTLPTGSPYEWREITLGNGYSLTANTKYAIVARAPDGAVDNDARWREDWSSPTYTGGCQETSVDSGSSWTGWETADMMFEEWATLTSRTTALLRTDTVLLGLKATASRIITPIRAQTALLGLKATASQAVDYAAKTGTALLGLLATGSRTMVLNRSKTALLGLKATGAMSTLGHYIKEAVVYLGLAVTGTRSIVLARVDMALLGLKATATKAITLTRTDTALLGLKATGILIIPYIRTGTVYLGLKITASRSFALTRLNTAMLGLKAVATRSLALSRAKTALLGLKVIGSFPAVGRALRLVIVTTQNRKLNIITSLYRKIRILTE